MEKNKKDNKKTLFRGIWVQQSWTSVSEKKFGGITSASIYAGYCELIFHFGPASSFFTTMQNELCLKKIQSKSVIYINKAKLNNRTFNDPPPFFYRCNDRVHSQNTRFQPDLTYS